jgi:hypothetical protein
MGEKNSPVAPPVRLDYAKFAANIWETVPELQAILQETRPPASKGRCYIGSVVAGTLALMMAAFNSVSRQPPVAFTSADDTEGDKNVLNLIAITHRNFISSLHSVFDLALQNFCKENNVIVHSSYDLRIDKILKNLESKLSEAELKQIERLKNGRHSAKDTVNAATQHLRPERRQVWRRYCEGFDIIRNKASHADPTLSERDIEILLERGFGPVIIDGSLSFNFRSYPMFIWNFCQIIDEIEKAL